MSEQARRGRWGGVVTGTSVDSFEAAVAAAIASAPEGAGSPGAAATGTVPRRFEVLGLWVETGGVVGRPQYTAELLEWDRR